jgi:hypothetical protein
VTDITAIYLTLNRMPPRWVEFHMGHLRAALGDIPVVSVSRVPMDFGVNLVDDAPPCYSNYYRQILRGAMVADTKYIACVEDDVLYHENHFRRFRPADDEFAYNRCRWSVFSWGDPQYSLRNRISNCSCIAPRLLMIAALTERFAIPGRIHEGLMGECGRNDIERKLRITQRKAVEFFSRIPIVQLSHPDGTERRQREQRKSHAEVRAFDIPYWGRAQDILKHYLPEERST